VPYRFELSFGLKGRREVAHTDVHSRDEPVALDEGVRLRGSIDLVERGPGGALRATDHKTGRVRFERGAVVEGGQVLQPTLYALALEKLFAGTTVTGGRLYYCTAAGQFEERTVPLDADTRRAVAAVVRFVGERIDRADLPAAPAEDACRWCDYQAVCGPLEELRTKRFKPKLKDLDDLRGLR